MASALNNVSTDSGTTTGDTVEVSTPDQLKVALKKGFRHITVTEHLDLTREDGFKGSALNESMFSIVPGKPNRYPVTIRVCVHETAP